MAQADWDRSLETGNDLVDSQHKTLYGQIGDLHDAIVEDQPRETQESILLELVEYAGRHFKDEEALMLRVGYPGLGDQKKMHSDFAAEAQRLMDEHTASDTAIPIALAVFLREWLLKHIRVEDRQIGEFIREKGA